MASEHAIPQHEEEKKQGDKLEHVLDSAPAKGANTQDTSGKGSGLAKQDEPLK